MDVNFKHKIDRQTIPFCNILGVNVSAINMEWLIEFTKENIEKLSGDYVCVANVHTTVIAYEDKEYCNIQNGGILTIPDGGPLASLGRKRGHQEMKRTTGPSFMMEMLSLSQGYRHFFYGATPETLETLKVILRDNYPKAEVVGMISPPFRPLTELEDAEIIEKINNAMPDFVWVGLGAPKQEKWMAKHQGKIHGLMVGVGAGFDYLAGNIKRAPNWMQEHNLEWLFRLIQEPKRLFKRYLITNTKFIWHAMVRGR